MKKYIRKCLLEQFIVEEGIEIHGIGAGTAQTILKDQM